MSIFSNETPENVRAMPILALRGINIFPGMLINFDVERRISIAALDYATNNNQEIVLVTQRDITTDIPNGKDLFTYGVCCRIRQFVRQPGSKVCKVMAEGLRRCRIINVISESPYLFGRVVTVPDKPESIDPARKDAMIRNAVGLFDE